MEELLGRARRSREKETPATQHAAVHEDAGEGDPAVVGAAGGPGDQAAGGGDQAAGDGDDQAVDGASGGAATAKQKVCWNCQAPGGYPVKLKKCSGCRRVRCTFNCFLSRNLMTFC